MSKIKQNCSIALQVLPNVENSRVFSVVDEVIKYISSTGLTYEVGAFETTIEGELEQLLNIVKRAQEICVEHGSDGVMSYVKINYSPKGVSTIEEKVSKHRK